MTMKLFLIFNGVHQEISGISLTISFLIDSIQYIIKRVVNG